MTAPYMSYFRVWAALPHPEPVHTEFHRQLWAFRSDSGVIRLILREMEKSQASEADKLAVVQHLNDDWENARILASMASSCTVSPVSGDFAGRLTAIRESASLSIPDLARKSGLSDDAIRRYESGDRSPSWVNVQLLAKALGVPTDTFRDQ